MKILALDTATEACSVALFLDGQLTQQYAVIPRRHAAELLPMVRRVLAEADINLNSLDAIAFGRGPGSFTGLRIAAGAAQGLAFGADLPVVPVSTLAAIALRAHMQTGAMEILACLDARIDEVYWASLRVENFNGAHEKNESASAPDALYFVQEESLCAPEALMLAESSPKYFAAGNGLLYFQRFPETTKKMITAMDEMILPHAGDMAVLAVAEVRSGRCLPAHEAIPLYLRDKVTQV